MKYLHVWRAYVYTLPSSKLQVKAEFTKTYPLATWCPAILSFQTGMDATLLSYMYLGVPSSDVPV